MIPHVFVVPKDTGRFALRLRQFLPHFGFRVHLVGLVVIPGVFRPAERLGRFLEFGPQIVPIVIVPIFLILVAMVFFLFVVTVTAASFVATTTMTSAFMVMFGGLLKQREDSGTGGETTIMKKGFRL